MLLAWNSYYHVGCQVMIFCFHLSFSICWLELYYEEELSILPTYLFLSVISLHQYASMALFYPMDFNLLSSSLIYLFRGGHMSQIWPLELHSNWLLHTFDIFLSFLSTYLFSGTTKHLTWHFFFFLSGPGVGQFSVELCLLSLGNSSTFY